MERTFSIQKFRNFRLSFKKSRFPEKLSVRGDKINLSIYIPSEFFGQMVNNRCFFSSEEKQVNIVSIYDLREVLAD